MRFLACLICFLQIMWAGRSFAIVDVKNGNFTTSRIDLNYPAIGYNLRVHRTYNSEPIFQGMFGAGWCSDFETKLIVLSESEILVRQCGNGQDKFFSSKAAPQLNATLSQLRDRLTKEFPKEKMKIDGLIESSKTNLPLLATFVDAYKISVKPAKGSVFAIRTGGGELVRFDGKDFLLKWPDKRVQKFDSQGRIISEADGPGNSLIYVRAVSGRISEIRHSGGTKLSLKYNSDGRIAKITAPNNETAAYDYDRLGNLTGVKAKLGSETYQYKADHKLVKIGSRFEIQYDNGGRNVTSVKKDGCREDFSYGKKGSAYTVKSALKCKAEPGSIENFEVQIASGSRQPRVDSVSSTLNGGALIKSVYNGNGLPILIKNSQGETKFKYDKSERLESISLGTQLLRFSYSPEGLVQSAQSKEFRIDYKYNSLNRVTEYTSAGDTVKIKYDFLGRLVQIGRNKSPPYEIEYPAQSDAPKQISLRGKGRVNLLARDYRGLSSDKQWIGLDSAANLLTDYQTLQEPLRLISLSSVSR